MFLTPTRGVIQHIFTILPQIMDFRKCRTLRVLHQEFCTRNLPWYLISMALLSLYPTPGNICQGQGMKTLNFFLYFYLICIILIKSRFPVEDVIVCCFFSPCEKNLCLLSGIFRQLSLTVSVDMVCLKYTILLAVFQLFHFFFDFEIFIL